MKQELTIHTIRQCGNFVEVVAGSPEHSVSLLIDEEAAKNIHYGSKMYVSTDETK